MPGSPGRDADGRPGSPGPGALRGLMEVSQMVGSGSNSSRYEQACTCYAKSMPVLTDLLVIAGVARKHVHAA